MGKIYLGRKSYFKLPDPENKFKKAIINAIAQTVDFLDGDTVIKGKRGYKRVKFNYANGRGKAVSYLARLRIIEDYAPARALPYLEKLKAVAKAYYEGRISKREALKRIKSIGCKAIGCKETEKIIRKVRAKD